MRGATLAVILRPPPFTLSIDPREPPRGFAGAVYALGNFDGLHRGHKAVLMRARALAEARGAAAAVLTFEPHPSDYFSGASTIFRLTPLGLKARLAERFGMDGLTVLPFDTALAGMPAEAFVSDILVGRLQVSGVVAGYDFHFGAKRGGTPAFLRDAGRRHGFAVEVVDKVDTDPSGLTETASSTATRKALEAGDVARAAVLLGHDYSIVGTVLPGQRLGRTLGFPTANLQADPSCRLRHGIYAVRATVDGIVHDGVASWGRRPTVDNGAPLLETHLFDFAGDLYGRELEIAFVAWLRGEEKFASLDLLTVQMHEDAARARAALAGGEPASVATARP